MKRKTVIALLACVALAATGCGSKEKETEAPATEAVTTEAATTEAATEEETTEAATEEATTEAATEEETTEAATEEVTTEAATEEETTEAATETEEATTEKVTTEEVTEAETETEAASEEETTEAVSEEETTEAESETETETEIYFEDLPAYVASDYVTLGEYKGITVVVDEVDVTEEEVDEDINDRIIETLTEGTVEEGDIANIDYEGKKDGVAFDGGTSAGYDLEIGSDTFIDGFEDGLVGVAIGETVDLTLTFPEEYYSEDLAGQEVVFTVTVNSVQRVPELTDEVAAKVVLDDETTGLTAEELRAAVRAELEEYEAEEIEYYAKYDILSEVIANATIDGYPEEALSYNKWRVTDYYEQIAAMSGMDLETLLAYYGMDMETFETMVDQAAQEGLAQSLVLTAVAEAEGMDVTAEVYEEGLERYTAIQGFASSEDLVAEYGENYIKNSLMQEMALNFLYENANLVTASEAEAAEEATEEETTEEATEEETTEVATEAETVEVTEEETTEAATEVVTEEETTEAESETESETETETESETEA